MRRLARREFVAGSLGLLALRPAQAEQRSAIARIGYLSTRSMETPESRAMVDAFRRGMHEHGYIEGRNLTIELRGADGIIELFPDRARELVDLNPDLIVATNSLAARAVQKATGVIPIVVPVMGDPVGDGLVSSLARPGGNITGLTFLGPALVPKRLALLKEALPGISRVAALWHPGAYGERTMSNMISEANDAEKSLNVQLQFVPVRAPNELDGAFTVMSKERADALLVFPSPMLFTERKQIAYLSLAHRLPSMSMDKEVVALGGLMSYGASISDLHRRAAGLVSRILKGARPADLPVEQATTYELSINLKTAAALGLTIPPTLLARADEVIE